MLLNFFLSLCVAMLNIVCFFGKVVVSVLIAVGLIIVVLFGYFVLSRK